MLYYLFSCLFIVTLLLLLTLTNPLLIESVPPLDMVYHHLRSGSEARRNLNPLTDLNHGVNELDQWSSGMNMISLAPYSRARSNASSSGSSSSSHLLAVSTNAMHASSSGIQVTHARSE